MSLPQPGPASLALTWRQRCLAIARSHAIVGNTANALALINRSAERCEESATKLSGTAEAAAAADSLPLSVEVAADSVRSLGQLLNGELLRHRALVHLDKLYKAEKDEARKRGKLPLLERLHEYPAGGVDLTNLVEFPPKMGLIPMKPIFLDVAWNYIDYPGKAGAASTPSPAPEPAPAAAPQPKRGWFGFGRS